MDNIIDILHDCPIIPVVVANDMDKTLKLAEILSEENVPIMEVTLRRANALKIIKEVHSQFPSITLGAGTIKHPEQIASSLHAGASFTVSPGITKPLLEEAKSQAANFLPGAASASDILLGEEYNIKCYKLFPATAINGLDLIKAFRSPFPDVTFCPTGGIIPDNYLTYLQQTNVVSVGCTWCCNIEQIENEDWQTITTRVQQLKAGLSTL